jgi:hypothetical protein
MVYLIERFFMLEPGFKSGGAGRNPADIEASGYTRSIGIET